MTPDSNTVTDSPFPGNPILESTAVVVTETPTPHSYPGLILSMKLLFLFAIIVLPLIFGGVHLDTFAPFQMTLFVLTTVALFRFGLPEGRLLLVLYALGGWLLYLFLDVSIRSVIRAPHPVLGSSSLLSFPLASEIALLEIATFISLFYLLSLAVSRFGLRTLLVNFALFSACIVSSVALSHWFYDNGKLFWAIAPDFEMVSSRARWPFVNSNHLGHYCLLLLGLVGASLAERVLKKDISFTAESLSSRRGQKNLISLGFHAILIIALITSILATLSRGTWLGLGIGIMFLSLLLFTRLKKEDPAKRKRRRGRSSRARLVAALPQIYAVTVLLIGTALIIFFLQGRGQELILDRIEYGLLHSKDDMRWQLYKDSVAMFQNAPVAGYGIAQWNHFYPQFMDPGLSGLDPEYLHSDPFQLFIELGILGSLFSISIFLFILVTIFRKLREENFALPKILIATSLGMLLVASFLDFPTRIPAINVLISLSLALLLCHGSSEKKLNPENI